MGKRNHVTKRPGRSTAKGERVREPRTVRRPQSGVAIDTLDTDQAAEPGAPQYAPPASPRDPTHSLAPLEGLEGSLADERPSDSTASPAPHAPSPPMVGIGASAGGLDAFLRLLRHMPADTGLALVLVQHSTLRTKAYCRNSSGATQRFRSSKPRTGCSSRPITPM